MNQGPTVSTPRVLTLLFAALVAGCSMPLHTLTSKPLPHHDPEKPIATGDQSGLLLAQAEQADQPPQTKAGDAPRKPPTLSERLRVPRELPGADVPPISLPPQDPNQPQIRQQAIEKLFPALPGIKPSPQLPPLPGDGTLTLEGLQSLALTNSPLIVQADADVEAAIGSAIQAGAHPNPIVGYEADTVGSAGTRNYQGVFFTQTIKTAGKLELARAAANVDLMNTQLNARKARIDLISRVRAAYFAVLVARESVTVSQALVRFTDEAYRVQVEQLKGGQAAAYEPMYMRILAVTARTALTQAENRHSAAWRQLAATLGIPDLPPTELVGRADMPIPDVTYDEALTHVLNNHTDLLQARNLEVQARIKLRFEEVTPIPDVNVYSGIQKDFTTPPLARTTYNLQVGVPVPIFDRNKGGIRNAQGALIRSAEELARTRNELTTSLADAFERYQNNRVLIQRYRTEIIPDQSRVYRGVYERHQQEPEQVGFGDVVVAQQSLLTSIQTYITALGAQWTAVTDLANLLQVEDLAEINAGMPRPEPAP